MILDQLKLISHQLRVVELFISFPKSPRSSKSEIGAKSYVQNTSTGLKLRTQSGARDSVQLDGPEVGSGLSPEPKYLSV